MAEVWRFNIPLAPVTKKNSSQIAYNKATGRPFVMPSKIYRQYERDCMPWLTLRGGMKFFPTINRAVNVKCIFYMKTHRRADLTNLLEAVDDILVKYGVLEDDNYNIVAGHDGSRVRYDKDRPRTEITITTLEEENL